jgi:hypothetical protein
MRLSRNLRLYALPAAAWLAMWAWSSAQQSPSGTSSPKTKQKTKEQATASSSRPSVEGNSVYHNTEFGFIYKLPYGWVDRTKEMQDQASDPTKARLLLAAFERPPEAIGDTVNSAVVITAESVASYPGLKTAADYMGPLTELTTSKGFKVDAEPYESSVGTTPTVRADFVKDIGKLTMHQSSLVVMRKRFLVSFTFIGGGQDEVEELIEKLSFGAAKRQ